jgi:hypothetical protein
VIAPFLVDIRPKKLRQEHHAVIKAVAIPTALNQAIACGFHGCIVRWSQVDKFFGRHCLVTSAQLPFPTILTTLIDFEAGHTRV